MREYFHIGLCRIRELKECTYIPHIARLVEETESIANHLIKHLQDPKYSAYIKWAIAEYSRNNQEEVELYQIHFITYPREFDSKAYMLEKFKQLVYDYPSYWDNVLSSLKSKAAIKKRREYLVKNTQLMADECIKYEYTDLANLLMLYQEKQRGILAMNMF